MLASKRGFNEASDDEDLDDDSDLEQRETMRANRLSMEWAENQNSLIMRNPLEHFLSKRIMNLYMQVRNY